jgi:hypothetical protein
MFSLYKIIITTVVVGSILYFGKIGSYESLPYRSTIYIEPSRITEQLKKDGQYGIVYDYNYIAYYKNPIANSDINKSIVYYIATKSKAKSLIDETYFNKDGIY